MKDKAIVLVTLTIFFAAGSAALQADQNSLSQYQEQVNQNSDQIPGFVKALIGDQNINIYIDQGEPEARNLSLEMSGLRVEEIDNRSLENPDLEVWASSGTIENVTESENSLQQLKNTLDNGRIDYQTNGAWTKVKMFFAETFIELA